MPAPDPAVSVPPLRPDPRIIQVSYGGSPLDMWDGLYRDHSWNPLRRVDQWRCALCDQLACRTGQGQYPTANSHRCETIEQRTPTLAGWVIPPALILGVCAAFVAGTRVDVPWSAPAGPIPSLVRCAP